MWQVLLEMLELKVPFSDLKPQEIVRALMNGSPLPQVSLLKATLAAVTFAYLPAVWFVSLCVECLGCGALGSHKMLCDVGYGLQCRCRPGVSRNGSR